MSLRLTLAPYELRFALPVTTARGIASVRRGAIVRITNGTATGYGEVATWPGFGSGVAQVEGALAEITRLPLPSQLPEGSADAQALCDDLRAPIEVRAALATALFDAMARRAGAPLAALLAAEPAAAVPVGALARDVEEARSRVTQGVRTLKVKIGSADLALDLARVRSIRDAVGPGVHLRVDANQAYTASDAERLCAALCEMGVDYVEEPLREPSPEGLAALRRRTGVRIAIDESLSAGAARYLDAACCDVVVIKPSFVGGPLAAATLARQARALGIGVSVGTAFESAVGRAAALHVAAAVASDRAAGLSSPLATDLAELPAIIGGVMSLPLGAGLGVTPRLGGWS